MLTSRWRVTRVTTEPAGAAACAVPPLPAADREDADRAPQAFARGPRVARVRRRSRALGDARAGGRHGAPAGVDIGFDPAAGLAHPRRAAGSGETDVLTAARPAARHAGAVPPRRVAHSAAPASGSATLIAAAQPNRAVAAPAAAVSRTRRRPRPSRRRRLPPRRQPTSPRTSPPTSPPPAPTTPRPVAPPPTAPPVVVAPAAPPVTTSHASPPPP